MLCLAYAFISECWFFKFSLQMCVFPNAFILLPHLLVVNLLQVSCYYLHNGCYCNEGRVLVGVDDLDFKVRDVAFETKVFNKYDTFDEIMNRTMENPSYTL
jgi:hypothetical protein